MEASLKKMVEGEIISDYQCDNCKQRVDLKKRSLIAETPNVLIVHLQRLVFNFDTFQNEKVNTRFEFPNVLDLKPFSFKTVMTSKVEDAAEDKDDVEEDNDSDNSAAATEANIKKEEEAKLKMAEAEARLKNEEE